MFEKLLFRSLAAAAFAAALPAAAARADSITHGETTINMDFVPVGNPGNTPDDEVMWDGTTEHGSVGYTFRIGKYEVSENQWDAVVAADESDLLDDPGYWSGDQPVAGISWREAAMFCNWLTSGDVTLGAYAINGSGQVTGVDRDAAARAHGTVYVVPTEDEWYKAAYYDPNKGGAGVPGYWDYPTKHDIPNGPHGTNSEEDTTFDAVFWDLNFHDQGHPNDVDNAGVLSAYGTMGQGGNVWDWTETQIAPGSWRMVRGGSWKDDSMYLAAATVGSILYPSDEVNYFGFRVASVPEPGSITLLLCGVIAGMIWWRRRR